MLIKENIDQKKKLWEKNELEDCVRMLINKIHYFLKYLWYLSAFYLFSFYFTILYWSRHALTWLHHGCTRVPHPEPPTLLPPHTIPLGHPSAPAPSILYPASNLDWRFVSYMILYMFQCHSPKSSHPLPQSPKDCSIHLCLFCCLAYRLSIIIVVFSHSFNIYFLEMGEAWRAAIHGATKSQTRLSDWTELNWNISCGPGLFIRFYF